MRFLTFLITFLCCHISTTASIKIGVFDGEKISQAKVEIDQGSYELVIDNGAPYSLSSSEKLTVTIEGTSTVVRGSSFPVQRGAKILLRAVAFNSEFSLTPTIPSKTGRRYHDNLIVKIRSGKLQLINETNLDKYVSGVVEAETGAQHNKEFYKVQAIISRTYALSNKHKHASEGFHLCDKVHCQVFKGKARYNDDILFAAYETEDKVLVDDNIELITAAFHSNCGGQTISSGKVWTQNLSYLQSVPDTFCLTMSQSHWEKRIPKTDWLNYLKKNGIDEVADSSGRSIAYTPGAKEEHFLGNEKLRMVDIRKDLKLRSAWFTVYEEGNEMVIQGRGFGHGVGLCQEGAINRARHDHTYEEILYHYYKGVHLVDLDQLEFFRE